MMLSSVKENTSTSVTSDAFVKMLMQEHGHALAETGPFHSDTEYMLLNELKYTLKSVRANVAIKMFESFTRPGSFTITAGVDGETKSTKEKLEEKHVDCSDMAARREHLDMLIQVLDDHITARVQSEATEDCKAFTPRILKLCDHYKLSAAERALMHIMVIVQGSNSPYVLNCLVEEDYFKRLQCFQRLSELSEADIDHFCDPDRAHLKEGLVTSEEDHGIHFNLRCSRTCVQVLYGYKLHSDEMLKVSQTALELILTAEKQQADSRKQLEEEEGGQIRRRAASISSGCGGNGSVNGVQVNGVGSVSRKRKNTIEHEEEEGKKVTRLGEDKNKDGGCLEVTECDQTKGGLEWTTVGRGGAEMPDSVGHVLMDEEVYANIGDDDADKEEEDCVLDEEDSTTSFLPYPANNQLEYLEEGFQVVAVMIRANAARLKDDMKKEGTRMNSWDMGGESKGGRRELQAKFSLLEKRMEKRLAETQKHIRGSRAGAGGTCSNRDNSFRDSNNNANGCGSGSDETQENEEEPLYAMPRLEVIARRLNLDSFEKKIILLLMGKTVSPLVKTLMDTLEQSGRLAEDMANVGQVLSILCQDFRTQIANRKYFYRSGRLISNGIISMSKGRWHQNSGDLTDQRLMLDRRVLDWAVGLDSEINELVEGSDLYVPKVCLQQVVLPRGQLGPIVKQCRAYGSFCGYRKERGLEQSMCYGNGLVILLCGKSGTGKTMTVNAIAQDLGKKVLLVDFGSLSGRRDGAGELDADLRGLFREAKMSNAVIFFDECETIFRSRDKGGDRLLNALLTEIERHEGIVFLATNRPHDLDEAMHRRITSVVQFHPPDFNMRLRIWESLLDIQRQPTEKVGEGNSATPAETSSLSTLTSSKCDEVVPQKDVVINKLPAAADVDLASLAIKYELTGGFIKNALLSALLSALNKLKGGTTQLTGGKDVDAVLPGRKTASGADMDIDMDSAAVETAAGAVKYADVILTQSDLEEGCRLQMRSSLSVQHQDSKIHPKKGLSKLFLSKDLKDCMTAILQMEQARGLVHGSWGGIGGDNAQNSGKGCGSREEESISSMLLSGEVDSWSDTRHSTICTFAGPAGSGKRTLLRALAYDLNRTVHMVHASDLVSGLGGGRRGGGEIADTIAAAVSLLHDARIGDAVVAIDAFEHLLDQGEEGGRGWKLNMLLSRLLEVFSSFPGLIVFMCHVDNPQNLILQKEFASKIFSFVRFNMPSHEVRSALWRELTPPGAPLAATINYSELGRRFELYPASIAKAMSRACAVAVSRIQAAPSRECSGGKDKGKSIYTEGLSQKDLMRAGDEEVAKLKGDHMNIMNKMFL